jgi:chromosome partitioning protein
MSKLIVVANQKGGVGKTTISMNLAHCMKAYASTGIIELDAQRSILRVADKMVGIPLLLYTPGVRDFGPDYVFIDTPPYLSDKLPHAFAIADLILIPTKAGPFDVDSCQGTVELIAKAKALNPGLKAAILLNMVNSSTKITEFAYRALLDYGLPILKTRIGERSDFVRSVALADGIYSTDNKKAHRELNSLVTEVMVMLNN